MAHHSNRICLLTCAATCNPYTQRLASVEIFDQAGDDHLVQALKHLGVAEKTGDVDQHVLGQQIALCRVVPQQVEVSGKVARQNGQQPHTPLYPPPDRSRLILTEILRCRLFQKRQDVGHPRGLIAHHLNGLMTRHGRT